MVAALYLTLERQPMQLGLLKEGDWAGIVTMAIGLSALQTVLEEGNKDDWFASPFIVSASPSSRPSSWRCSSGSSSRSRSRWSSCGC